MTTYSIEHGAGAIEYELIRSRRKTLGIIVHPDQSVTVRAPLRASPAEVQALVREKVGWIVKKQRMFEAYPSPAPPPTYANGENHLYLGRPYPLTIIEGGKQGVSLADGRFLLHVRDANDLDRKRNLMIEWYRARARARFAERLDACYPTAARHGIPFPTMKIRLMKKRWGSCSSKGTIQLNLRLIQTPPACIDYVIFHELAHLNVHHHNKAFYTLLEKMLPDWRPRREELNKIQVV